MHVMDGFHLPDPGACEFVEFFADLPGGNDTILNFQQFIRPRHAKFMGVLLIGAGGGGASGGQAADGVARFGGGGGACNGVGYMTGPASAFPESMFIRVGGGGPGGVGNNVAGVTGGATYVSASPNFSGVSRLLQYPGGGGAGAGATAGATPNVALGVRAMLIISGTGGTAGIGGAQTLGANATNITANCANGAAGGGLGAVTGQFTVGGNQPGQGMNASAFYEDNLFGGQTAGAMGSHGYADWRGMRFKGGAGGASNGAGVGGNGGDGAYGCGGGGGGAGVTSGNGGRGGDGIVRVFWW